MNCLSTHLGYLIFENQGAFVGMKEIHDTIFIAKEIFHILKQNKLVMANKTDMSKAYDRVEWDFLEAFTIIINQSQRDLICPSCGLHRGDLL